MKKNMHVHNGWRYAHAILKLEHKVCNKNAEGGLQAPILVFEREREKPFFFERKCGRGSPYICGHVSHSVARNVRDLHSPPTHKQCPAEDSGFSAVPSIPNMRFKFFCDKHDEIIETRRNLTKTLKILN
jgi:hypothetical protein